jgi:hypothetical protein
VRSRVAEGTSQEGLPHTDGAEKDDVLVTFDEAEREEIADAVAVEGDRRIPVEAFEGVFLIETRLRESDAQVLVIAPVDLVLQHELEQIELRELLLSCVGDAVRECGDDPAAKTTSGCRRVVPWMRLPATSVHHRSASRRTCSKSIHCSPRKKLSRRYCTFLSTFGFPVAWRTTAASITKPRWAAYSSKERWKIGS